MRTLYRERTDWFIIYSFEGSRWNRAVVGFSCRIISRLLISPDFSNPSSSDDGCGDEDDDGKWKVGCVTFEKILLLAIILLLVMMLGGNLWNKACRSYQEDDLRLESWAAFTCSAKCYIIATLHTRGLASFLYRWPQIMPLLWNIARTEYANGSHMKLSPFPGLSYILPCRLTPHAGIKPIINVICAPINSRYVVKR